MSTETLSWDKCSRCKAPIERGSDGHIFCFYPNKEYIPTVTGRYCKTCTAALFREMDLAILLKELTHMSLNFGFAFPILLEKLNVAHKVPHEKKPIKPKFPISDKVSNVFTCHRCHKHIYSIKEPHMYFIEREGDDVDVYCRACCEIVYRNMNIIEMVEEMMSGAIVQKIGVNVLKERLKEREKNR